MSEIRLVPKMCYGSFAKSMLFVFTTDDRFKFSINLLAESSSSAHINSHKSFNLHPPPLFPRRMKSTCIVTLVCLQSLHQQVLCCSLWLPALQQWHVLFIRTNDLCRADILAGFEAVFVFQVTALSLNWLDPTFRQTELDTTFRLNILSLALSLFLVLTDPAHVTGFLFLQLSQLLFRASFSFRLEAICSF